MLPETPFPALQAFAATLTPDILLEWAGAATGLAGAFALALNIRSSRWGWVAFLASNLLLIALLANLHRWGLVLMQAGFLTTSVLGIYRSFFARPSEDQMDPVAVQQWLERRGLVAMPAGVDFRVPVVPSGLSTATSKFNKIEG